MDKLYTKEKVEEIRSLDKEGELVTIFRVWSTTKGGTRFHLDIPERLLGTDKAIEMLNKRAEEIDAL